MDLFITTFVAYAKSILPWFLLGTVAAFLVDRAVDKQRVHSFLGKVTPPNIVAALAIGMVSPLSIMSALPISGELIRLGAQPLMLLIFLIAERAYDLQSFFIISDLFGLKIAATNAFIIFTSLAVTAWYFRKIKLQFINSKKGQTDFWPGQIKTLLIVFIGISVGAALRVVIPLTSLGVFMTSWLGSVINSLALGFSLYFGTILGNYPIAKSLADLGMAPVGTMLFLSVSPIFNLIVITLFLSVIKNKYVIKVFLVYTLTSIVLSLVLSQLFLI